MIDESISAWFQANHHPQLTRVMLVFTHWHSTAGLLAMAAAVGLFLLLTRRPWWLLALLVSVPGGMLLNVTLKHMVQRTRPSFDNPLLTLSTYSFPSGHAAGSTLFYGFLVALLLSQVESPPWRATILFVAVVMVLLVATSRVYLGVHYFTDVVVGIVVGMLWLGACLAGVRNLWRGRASGAPR